MPSAFYMILKKELKDSLKSKWLVTFAVTFFFLALGVPYIILGAGGLLPQDYPGMVVGTLIPLAVPLGVGSEQRPQEARQGTPPMRPCPPRLLPWPPGSPRLPSPR